VKRNSVVRAWLANYALSSAGLRICATSDLSKSSWLNHSDGCEIVGAGSGVQEVAVASMLGPEVEVEGGQGG
jgi:hypothetical protein